MKKTQLFNLALIVLATYTLSSCGCDCSNMKGTISDTNKETNNATRGDAASNLKKAFVSIDQFKFEGKIQDLEVIGKAEEGSINANDDAEAVKSIMRTLMGAESTQKLDVELAMSDEPVADGMFVFSIKSQDEKNITLQMYDEEGFDIVAYNRLQINSGNNYKALNVNDFENGSYLFKLTDQNGSELIRRVTVAKD